MSDTNQISASEHEILEKETPMRSLWDMMRDAAPSFLGGLPPKGGFPLGKLEFCGNDWTPRVHMQALSRLNRNVPRVYFDFEHVPELTKERAEAYGLKFVEETLPETVEVEAVVDEKPLKFASLSTLAEEDGSIKMRILASLDQKYMHYVQARKNGKTNRQREAANYEDIEVRVLANSCDSELCKRLIALTGDKKDLHTQLGDLLKGADVLSFDTETSDGGLLITIDSIPTPSPRRKKSEPKKAKGYQPPAWVTKRSRGARA